MKKKDYIGRIIEKRYVDKNTGEVTSYTFQIKKIKDNNCVDKYGTIVCNVSEIDKELEIGNDYVTISLI